MFVIVLLIDIQYLKILGRDKKLWHVGKCMNIVPHAITINQTSIIMRNIYRKIQLMIFSVFFSISIQWTKRHVRNCQCFWYVNQ